MQVFRSTLAFFERHLGASASERYPRPAIDERRMKVLNKLVEPRGEPIRQSLLWPCCVLPSWSCRGQWALQAAMAERGY